MEVLEEALVTPLVLQVQAYGLERMAAGLVAFAVLAVLLELLSCANGRCQSC